MVIATNRFEKQKERALRIVGIPYSFDRKKYKQGLNEADGSSSIKN